MADSKHQYWVNLVQPAKRSGPEEDLLQPIMSFRRTSLKTFTRKTTGNLSVEEVEVEGTGVAKA